MRPPIEPVLLLHGQPGGARDWDRVVTALGARAHPIVIDRPGWDGRSAALGIAANAEFAVAALDAHDIAAATVAGHSFGAAVACWLAAARPERVRALVLAAPSANVASLYAVDHWLASGRAGYLASAVMLEMTGLALGARAMRRRIAADLALEESYLEAAGRVLRGRSARHAFALEQRALIDELPALERQLGGIKASTKIVAGARDRVVPLASQRQLAAQIPQAELLVLPHAGHLIPLRHAERLAEVILSSVPLDSPLPDS